jgi:serpin B
MGKQLSCFVFLTISVLSAPLPAEPGPPATSSHEDLSALADGNREFAIDLYQSIRNRAGNLCFSPLSLSTTASMAYAGARGETERQIARTLHFPLPQERLHQAFHALALALDQDSSEAGTETGFRLNVAHSLWGQQGYEYRQQYLDLIAEHYGADFRAVDFIDEIHREEAARAINRWASRRTQGKIENLVSERVLTELTRLVLANIVYLDAKWKSPQFSGTREQDFTLKDGTSVSTPTMSRHAKTLYARGAEYLAVELPYQGNRAAMIVILPDSASFTRIEESLGGDLIDEVGRSLVSRDVLLSMPRFTIESRFDLTETLADLGMPDAFDSRRADFSGLTGGRALFLTNVLHKVYVSVDEEGTEAAAATAITSESLREGSLPLRVKINRPFLFLIYDRATGTILFLGRLLEPGS